jgi:hypothetical protein
MSRCGKELAQHWGDGMLKPADGPVDIRRRELREEVPGPYLRLVCRRIHARTLFEPTPLHLA